MEFTLSKPGSSLGQRWMNIAALLGWCFVISHVVTVAVTCAVEGFNWGINAWVLDVAGFLAGLFFSIQCWLSSRSSPGDFRSGNLWILIWATITVIFRVVDTLMLFGVLKWSVIYTTPEGAVLGANVISEVIFGMAFAMTALVAAIMLLASKTDPKSVREN